MHTHYFLQILFLNYMVICIKTAIKPIQIANWIIIINDTGANIKVNYFSQLICRTNIVVLTVKKCDNHSIFIREYIHMVSILLLHYKELSKYDLCTVTDMKRMQMHSIYCIKSKAWARAIRAVKRILIGRLCRTSEAVSDRDDRQILLHRNYIELIKWCY